jgi:NTE family protein
MVCFSSGSAWSLTKVDSVLVDKNNIEVNKRPKIGLVLSGGGAKGMAHIGVLKVLEELGIRPDYISGTSMGSIVGGLYALGYSADSLKNMMISQNWSEVLTNTIPLKEVNINEKDEYKHYVADFKISSQGIELPSGIIEGQKLSQVLTRYCWPSYQYETFADFPIPFFCVGSDITTGQAVIFDQGDMAEALRGSMAIPTIFTAVSIDDRYIVDGGLVRNFPVKETIDRGADIIIGSYVGAEMKSRDQLSSMVSLLKQSTMLLSVMDSEENKPLCDVLIEPDLGEYSPADFYNADSIIDRGEIAARKMKKNLKSLIDSINYRSRDIELHEHEKSDLVSIEKIKIKHVEYVGLENVSHKLVTGKLNLKPENWYSAEDIEESISRLYGTLYFDKIKYRITSDKDGALLTMIFKEKYNTMLSASLNYNNETKGGVLVGLTLRNSILKASKWSTILNISELPSLRTEFSKYVGAKQSINIIGGGEYNSAKIKGYNNSRIMSINSIRTAKLYLGAEVYPESSMSIGLRTGKGYTFMNSELYANYSKMYISYLYTTLSFKFNTLDRPYWSTRGFMIKTNLNYYYDNRYKIKMDTYKPIGQTGGLKTVNSNRPAYFTFDTRFKYNVRIFSDLLVYKHTAFLGISSRSDNYNQQYRIGGAHAYLDNSVPFLGYRENAFMSNNVIYNKIELQSEVYKDFFVTAFFNAGYFSSESSQLGDRLFKFNDWIGGGGIAVGYNSVFGPIELHVAKLTDSDTPKLYFSVGYRLW